jgi:hypothetical protein
MMKLDGVRGDEGWIVGLVWGGAGLWSLFLHISFLNCVIRYLFDRVSIVTIPRAGLSSSCVPVGTLCLKRSRFIVVAKILIVQECLYVIF